MEYKKFYFCNLDFGKQLTGIERSALKRAQVFKKYLGIDPIFLTTMLHIDLHSCFQKLKDLEFVPQTSEVYGLFEYLRGSYDSYRHVREKQEINKNSYNVVDVIENSAHEKWYSKTSPDFIKYVVYTDLKKDQALYINSLYKGHIVKREKYDSEGRLFMVQEVNLEGQTTIENIIHLDGHVVLQMYLDEKYKVQKYVLFSKNGLVEDIFTNESQLVDYWLQKFINHKIPSCFIVDRNLPWNHALRNFNKESGHLNISIIHNSHLLELEKDIINGRLNYHFADVLQEKFKVDHIVTLTEHQRSDILKRFPERKNIITIPHSVDFLPKRVDFGSRDRNKIVVMCRLAADKQVEHSVLMMKKLIVKHPKLKLYIYGDGNQKQNIINKIKELEVEENVFVVGYIDDIYEVFNDAVFFLLTSRIEGCPLVLLESLSYGVPMGSYNIAYGPPSLIEDQQNGFIVEHGEYEELAEKISSVLNDDAKLMQLSQNAYDSIEPYKEENVAKIWKNLLNQ